MSSVPHSRVAAKAPGPQPAPVFRQSSLPLPRAFRAPPVRLAPVRLIPVGADMKARLLAIWPGLMLRKFSSDAQNAAAFGVERQTASYWRNGDTGSNGAAVALAWLLWPDELARLLGSAA